jgi:hypothetical protein
MILGIDLEHRLRWLTRRKSPGKICRHVAISVAAGLPRAGPLQK